MKKNFDIIMILVDSGGNLNIINVEKSSPLAYGDSKLLKNLSL